MNVPRFLILILLSLHHLFTVKTCFINERISPENFLIWGPGLKANFTMPVRYFFIQPVDNDRKNCTHFMDKKYFHIKMHEVTHQNKPNRIHIEVLNGQHGLYIVRYRIYDNFENLQINIQNSDGVHLSNSPYILNKQLYEEHCSCPVENLEDWYKIMNCNQTYNQIEEDMKLFSPSSLDMNDTSDEIIKTYDQIYSQSLCHYVIKNNNVKLPDLEFFMNLGDWPLNQKKINKLLPIVSWCGSTESNDLILPTYDITQATLEMMSRQSLDVFSIQANTGPKWINKINKSFWRGRDSRKERLDLVLLSKKRPDLIDAALTNLFFYREPEYLSMYGPIANHTSFFEFFKVGVTSKEKKSRMRSPKNTLNTQKCAEHVSGFFYVAICSRDIKYKYLINIDGTVAAYRLPFLLTGDSLILKQASPYYEHFYSDLKPYVHYIPFKRDLSDLVEKLNWAIKNQKKVENMIENAQNYAREYFMPHHILCYHVKFFEKYARILSSRTLIREHMVKITTRGTNEKICQCASNLKNQKSEL